MYWANQAPLPASSLILWLDLHLLLDYKISSHLAALLFLELSRCALNTRSFHLLFPLPGIVFPQTPAYSSPFLLSSWLQCHHHCEAFLNHLIDYSNSSPVTPLASFPALFSPWHLSLSDTPYILLFC